MNNKKSDVRKEISLKVGHNMKKTREGMQMTQAKVAEKVNALLPDATFDEKTLRRFELGQVSQKITTMYLIAHALGVSVDEFLSDEIEKMMK